MADINLAKNTTFYTAGLTIQKIISFVYFIYVARMIGVANTGRLSFALGFTTIFAMFLDFGLTQILIRESARDKEKSQKYLAAAIGLKLFGSVLIYGLAVLIINLMNYPILIKQLVYLSGIVMILDSFTLSFYGVLRGNHNLKFESLSVILNQLIIVITGVIVIKLQLGLIFLIGAYLMGSAFNFIYSLVLLKVKLRLSTKIKFEWAIIKELLMLSLPFAIAGIFVRLYSAMDIVLLSKLTNDQAVGWYSAAYKVAFALQFVGVASLASIYPAFCAYFRTSKELLAKTFTKIMYYLMVLSFPLAVGVLTIADKIIVPIFGQQYANSIPPLQILILSLPLAFLSFPVGAMLNACNKQTVNTVILGITAGVNIILNLLLIPYLSYIGSAVAALLSYFVLFGAGIFFVNKIVSYDKKYLMVSLGKILVSCLAMGIVVMYLKNYIHFSAVIIFGVFVYLAVLYAIKGFVKNDFYQIFTLLFKKS
ncbi:MAG: flippase [Patescibacteria group bacterium]